MSERVNATVGGAFVVAACIFLGSVTSLAQTPGEQGQPAPRSDRPDLRPPAARQGENYDPKGVPVGSFRLFPELEMDEVYNDNIYATSPATGKTGSFIQQIKPSLNLRSDWSEHMLNMFATGSFGLYSLDSNNDYYDYGTGANGRYDIKRDWNVYGGGSFNHLHEARGTPTSLNSGVQPNQYNLVAGNVGYFQKFNRLSGRLDGRVDNYTYTNEPLGSALPNSDRNRTEFREAARFGYELVPGFEAWVRGSLNQRQYVTNPDTSGFFRGSQGFDVVGGLAIDFGGITSIELFAGYVQQNYISPFTSVSAPTFGIAGYWNPIRELFVKPFLRRTVEEAGFTDSSAYLNTTGGVDVDYVFRPNIRLLGHVDYTIADYNQAITSNTGARYDQYLNLKLDAQYLLTPNFYVGPTYQFTNRWSNQLNSDYNQNIFMLRLGTRI